MLITDKLIALKLTVNDEDFSVDNLMSIIPPDIEGDFWVIQYKNGVEYWVTGTVNFCFSKEIKEVK